MNTERLLLKITSSMKAMLIELVCPTSSPIQPVIPETRRKPKLIWFDTGNLITINTSIGKSCKKHLVLLEKSCNFTAETMEKSCKYASKKDNRQTRKVVSVRTLQSSTGIRSKTSRQNNCHNGVCKGSLWPPHRECPNARTAIKFLVEEQDQLQWSGKNTTLYHDYISCRHHQLCR